MSADKLRTQQQLENLQARYVGTGHSDTTKFEFTSNIKRDSYASFIGHPPMLSYMAVGAGVSRERMRLSMIDSMIRPVGPPPEEEELRHKDIQPQFFGKRAELDMKDHFSTRGEEAVQAEFEREHERQLERILARKAIAATLAERLRKPDASKSK
ncbi:uncharacterized protein K452DRAFT_302992 [Aplosporella prunicola CBS 121167]|uniref:Splicing factor subunit n=1 Tax=Aplosporella prunicola CBS 121167 TaxID=1176127 RepID=A0A6A6B0A8_9PEZI|nr:uncharacterized protein K452DRAFT_302992 [Aplosporella prunicola CBS 121167]KAF2136141.1 hypothetical protein K452DRAFT_302992 [Aplosporella prunicola CBS 121167]